MKIVWLILISTANLRCFIEIINYLLIKKWEFSVPIIVLAKVVDYSYKFMILWMISVLSIMPEKLSDPGPYANIGTMRKIVNIKKGQFLSGSSMRFAVEKVQQSGNNAVMLTERGNFFGYQDLVVDYRNIYDMKQCGVPVVMDVTHSLQQPNQTSGVTGGKPELISLISKAAIAVGADGIFMETHPKPKEAKSDGANMLRLDLVEPLLEQLLRIKEAL